MIHVNPEAARGAQNHLQASDQAIASPRVLAGVLAGAAVPAFWINAFGIREALVGTPPAHEKAGEPRADD
ncbi:MAG: hypothetical protein AB1651_04155 [Pseudomonadota bacterium]